jgi:FkbM family methyltransferase
MWCSRSKRTAAARGRRDAFPAARASTRNGRFAFRAVSSYRVARIVTSPPIQRIAFGDLLLDDFAAAARWHRETQRDPHEEDFAIFRHMAGPHECFVDLGANIGNSVVSFRLLNRTAPIVSFEPGFWLEPALRHLQRHDPALAYHMVGVGERAARVPFYIPALDRRPDFYLASMMWTRFEEPRLSHVKELMHAAPGQQFAVCEVEVEVAPLDDFGLAPTIIKVDVEDWEPEALHGGRATVARHRPLVLVEGANRRPEIVTFFREQRYEFCTREGDRLRIADGPTPASNGFYVATERCREYRARGLLR